MKLVPFNIDEMKLVKGSDIFLARERYLEHLIKSREQDKKEQVHQVRRIYRFKHKEKIKEYMRGYKRKNHDRLLLYRKTYYRLHRDEILKRRSAHK